MRALYNSRSLGKPHCITTRTRMYVTHLYQTVLRKSFWKFLTVNKPNTLFRLYFTSLNWIDLFNISVGSCTFLQKASILNMDGITSRTSRIWSHSCVWIEVALKPKLPCNDHKFVCDSGYIREYHYFDQNRFDTASWWKVKLTHNLENTSMKLSVKQSVTFQNFFTNGKFSHIN